MTVRELFQDRRQYCVPFYQRAYVWNQKDQWEPLWNDIRDKAQSRLQSESSVPHFLGAVVVEPQTKVGLRGVDTLHIIDGQQRLTTLQYVLTSLVLALRETGVQNLEAMLDPCRFNGNPETMINPALERYKVWPTFRDREHFTKALAVAKLGQLRTDFPAHFVANGELRKISIVHPPSLEAIWYFTGKFISWIETPEGNPDEQAEALAAAILQDLKVVSIVLEPNDDAQVIFETLNGRGAALSGTDLIRNFLFMRADRDGDDAQALYDSHWSQFEKPYWSAPQRRGRLLKPRLEWLIHTTLQAETHSEVDLPRLYSEYKAYATAAKTPRTAAQQLATLDTYAEHYQALTEMAGSLPIARFGKRIAAYDITTLHSLALTISVADIAEEDKRLMLADLVSFVVRRAVCGLTPKGYNNVFMSALRHLARTAVSPQELRKALGSSDSMVSRWPRDAEFKNACQNSSLYYGMLDSVKMRGFLTELEGGLRGQARTEEPELPDLSALDVDHIMPRSWYEHWPMQDGWTATSQEAQSLEYLVRNGATLTPRQEEMRKRIQAISTLGNLTLLNLSVNRQAQNYAYPNKRDLLIANTVLRLNVPLTQKSQWTVEDIAQRGEMLSAVAVRVWPGPPEQSED